MSTELLDLDFKHIFEEHRVGQKVFEDLVARFGGNPYQAGGHEADRATAFNAGKLEVIQYILRRINRANGVNDDESMVET